MMFAPGDNCWRVERATRGSVIVDAEDYFRVARTAMREARQRIMLVGWDFDARIALGDADDGGPDTVGEFILWLVQRNPELDIYLLRWNMGAVKTLFRGRTWFTVLRWMRHPRIHTKLDGAHPAAGSHHQKIVVIDDCFAFCGGIDMTAARWDTRAHADDDPGRVWPHGGPYAPWHDATSALEGPVAAALGDLCRTRWAHAGGKRLDAITGPGECWPTGLPVEFRDIDIAIARSAPAMPDREPIREIETLYLAMIARAQRFIYAESQYFASRRVAKAIARRLDEPDGPEIVIVNPTTAQGWLEPIAMDSARARLMEALRRRDTHGRLRMYHPFTQRGEAIYVHAKVMIVDDEMLRVGSSNLNNRSMRLDTECDIVIEAVGDAVAGASVRERIAAIRLGLIAEHLACDVATLDPDAPMIATIERLRGAGNRLRPYEVPDLSAVDAWLADNEVLDPEGPEEMFESLTKRSLFRRLRRLPA